MKIGILNNTYTPYKRGGADNIAEYIANGLKKNGHNIFVISTKPYLKKQKTNNMEQKIYHINSYFYYLNKINIVFRLFWHVLDMFSLRKYFTISKIIKKEKPDLIITHNLKGLGFLTPLAIRKQKIKHIHYLHDIQLIHPSGLLIYGKENKLKTIPTKLYVYLSKKLFKSPDTIISPSNWLLELHQKYNLFPKSAKINLPNPAIVDLIPDKAKKEKKTFNFLYVGEIEKHKGVLLLLEAFSKSDSFKNAKLTIIGRGTELEKSKKIYQNKNISFLGWQDNKIVKEKMYQSDTLIMPSYCYENSPTVIYEAAASKLPIIASNIGGAPELINLLGGFLFQANDANDLRIKMKEVMNKAEKLEKIKKISYQEIQKLSLDKYIKRLENIIKN